RACACGTTSARCICLCASPTPFALASCPVSRAPGCARATTGRPSPPSVPRTTPTSPRAPATTTRAWRSRRWSKSRPLHVRGLVTKLMTRAKLKSYYWQLQKEVRSLSVDDLPLRSTIRQARALRAFFRRTFSVAEAEGEIQRAMDLREDHFLDLARTHIYA